MGGVAVARSDGPSADLLPATAGGGPAGLLGGRRGDVRRPVSPTVRLSPVGPRNTVSTHSKSTCSARVFGSQVAFVAHPHGGPSGDLKFTASFGLCRGASRSQPDSGLGSSARKEPHHHPFPHPPPPSHSLLILHTLPPSTSTFRACCLCLFISVIVINTVQTHGLSKAWH